MAIPKNKNFSDYDNYLTDKDPTTAAQAQDYFKNQAELLKAVVDSGCWQPETNYAFGDVVYSPSFPKNAEAVCMKAGKSSTAEPAWNGIGQSTADGTVLWQLRYKDALKNGLEYNAARARGTDKPTYGL